MTDELVRLEVEAQATTALLQSAQDYYLPLPVAAAIAFHQAHGNTKAIVTRQDYDDALNIAAAALSRLITIHVLRDAREGRVRLAVDLTKSRFTRGATQLRTGNETLGELSVARADLLAALSLIKRAGLPFAFGGTKEL
jgi:hypothetical protein